MAYSECISGPTELNITFDTSSTEQSTTVNCLIVTEQMNICSQDDPLSLMKPFLCEVQKGNDVSYFETAFCDENFGDGRRPPFLCTLEQEKYTTVQLISLTTGGSLFVYGVTMMIIRSIGIVQKYKNRSMWTIVLPRDFFSIKSTVPLFVPESVGIVLSFLVLLIGILCGLYFFNAENNTVDSFITSESPLSEELLDYDCTIVSKSPFMYSVDLSPSDSLVFYQYCLVLNLDVFFNNLQECHDYVDSIWIDQFDFLNLVWDRYQYFGYYYYIFFSYTDDHVYVSCGSSSFTNITTTYSRYWNDSDLKTLICGPYEYLPPYYCVKETSGFDLEFWSFEFFGRLGNGLSIGQSVFIGLASIASALLGCTRVGLGKRNTGTTLPDVVPVEFL